MKLRKSAAGTALAALLALVSPCAVFAETAAESGTTVAYDGISADGTYGYHIMDDGNISIYCENLEITTADIPAEIDGYTVARLEDGCFSECMKLSSVNFPATLTSIGEQAFFDCMMLTEITIPATVTDLSIYAFDGAAELTAITIDPGHPDYRSINGVFFDKSGETLLKYPEARQGDVYKVPAGCKALADWSFRYTRYLKSVDLGSVTEIGAQAFFYCLELTDVEIPEGVTALPANCFSNCIALRNVNLPSTLRSIGDWCFFSCLALTDIQLPEGLEQIGQYAFIHCTAMKQLNIPESVEDMKAYCAGYNYDESTNTVLRRTDFTLGVTKDSPAQTYASSGNIPFTFVTRQKFTVYYVLIGVVAAIIIGLIAAIAAVLKKRQPDKGKAKK